MKKILYTLLLLCFTFFVFSCDNDDNYHTSITIKNHSETDIYLAVRGMYTYYGKCFMDSIKTLERDEIFKYTPYNGNIERQLRGGGFLEFYLVNPIRFNITNEYYDCDSLTIKNDILMHYKLTLKDLERMNWEIVYDGN